MQMEERRFLFRFFSVLIMALLLLHLPQISAVPLSRSFVLKNNGLPALQASHGQVPQQKERNLGERMARMDIEINDYPGSGANPRHDPRSPGRA